MSSKRQRKHKVLGSLKGKQQAPRLDALDLLDGEDGDEAMQEAVALAGCV